MAEPKQATMKVVMWINMGGTRNGEEWPKHGETIILPKAEAENMLQQKQAVTPAQWAKSRQKRG